MEQRPKALLLLEDGTLFEGQAFGAIGSTSGEICFNTGMTGYQEVFTDPSYYGQILIMNTAHVGNYGTALKEQESGHVKIAGLISRNLADKYSRSLADEALDTYLRNQGIVAIDQLDTRALVAHVRQAGAMNAMISSEWTDPAALRDALAKVPSMAGLELSSKVSTKEAYFLGNEQADTRIAVLDFGIKQSILTGLLQRGAGVKVFPASASFGECEAYQPHAYFLSNGPGDPEAMPYAIETVKQIIQSRKPIFGICLGHQLLALASGARTYKMHHGHRGLNHPVLNLQSGRSEITSQNHGFAVDKDTVLNHPDLEMTHINLNDDTLEGLRLKHQAAFSVQYHPEAAPGPHDSRYLFDQFLDMIAERRS